MTPDLERAEEVLGVDLEDEEGVLAETVPRGGDDQVARLDVAFHGSSIPFSWLTLHKNEVKSAFIRGALLV
jgi:hypothetical protein